MVRAEFPQVQLIANSEGLGFAKAANLALAKGRGSYFLISHPDIVLKPGAVQEMYTFLKTQPKVGIVGANLIYPDGSYCPSAYKKHSMRQDLIEFIYASFRRPIKLFPGLNRKFDQERKTYYWDHQTTAESDLVWNACMMFKREVLETVGNFYEGFYIWFADTDWCYRAKAMGWQMYYLVEAQVIHYEKQSANYIDNEIIRYKVKPRLMQKAVDRDRYMLLQRHYSPFFLWLKKILDLTSTCILYSKLALLRVFAPSRYRYLTQ
jgi:GT2 family glycosyltransferase